MTRQTAAPRLPGDPTARATVARMIRVDHAGEYGAKRIYEGQRAILGRGQYGPILRQMQAQEQVHNDTFRRLIAERRVRLGLVLAEIGRRNNVEVRNEELVAAIQEEARRFPGRERDVIQFYQQNPNAVAQIRAPLYEEKVVDFILELAQVTNVDVTREELMADSED